MTEVDEEPQFTSLSARIAALNQQGVGKSLNTQQQPATGKRPPPPLPAPKNRPPLPSRGQTINNPPTSTYGSSALQQTDYLPIGINDLPLLPPPPIDRDQPHQNNPGFSLTPPLPSRNNGPPPLPGRKASVPSLPPRSNNQLVRRGSDESMMSLNSTFSGNSGGGSSVTSWGSIEMGPQRKLPPALGEAKLPPLPPTRREREAAQAAQAAKAPLVSTKSAPTVPLRAPPVLDRDLVPKMPPRPTGQPKLPSRPLRESTNNIAEDEVHHPQPQRRIPPPTAQRSILSMGFSNKTSNETPVPAPRPAPTYTRPSYTQPTGPAVQELTARNFDSVTAGKFALIDFYAPYCKYCVELEPIWKQLGEAFHFASDRLVIAKVDVDAHKTFMSRYDIQGYPTIMFFDGTNPTPQKYQYSRDLQPLTDFLEEQTGIKVADGAHLPKPSAVPPPINFASKPAMSQVRAKIQAKAAHPPPSTSGCLLCRDFSGPDGVAAQYPRQLLPRSHDQTGYLADVLCGPFSSATDKARAIFTWLHHNIAYDTVAFFGKKVKSTEPQDTINSGLAVCAGYAGLYAAIALKAGLECRVVNGHGKGYGYTSMKPGEAPPPRDPTGHAWNAVRIDGGEWKLVDPCWGAGNVGDEKYNKHFSPGQFTMSNEDFGLKHFPQNDGNFFRADGRIPTWEEYILGPSREEPLQLFSNLDDHGISASSFSPPQKHIRVNSNEIIRFQFSKICEHWDHEKNGQGKPYCMIIKIHGVDGRKEDFVALEKNDFWWWGDVKARDLGAPGQIVSLYAVTTVNGRDMRGMTRREYLGMKGKPGSMGFAGVAAWELV
ncbi:hypothetical protein NA56DRAFT_125376 [Hyaloscypha hepaticicola]|uniref:Thioredoxin domain-containing protein n=1 Tax=Hyaloscypha hepaticicola TaxID=2082293 RepID=A0A2J6Q515_9HELO|nr:hypothetical protein NA56DRAFT_125376 [Hyaloscypha hepaticicola]